MIRRRALLALAAALAAALGPAAGALAADASDATAPVIAPVRALDDGLLAVMKASAQPFPKRYAMLEPVVEKSFALKDLLAACVGARWASLPADQQDQLLTAFRRFTVASYVANFNAYKGERFDVVPRTRASGNDQVVTTNIVAPTGSPQRLDYVMRQVGGAWRVVDILVDGTISRVATQRSEFRHFLTGNAAGPLVEQLNKKVADLSGGTLS